MSLVRIEDCAEYRPRIHDWTQPANFFWPNKMRLQTDHSMPRMLSLKKLPTFAGRSDVDSTGHVNADILTGHLLHFPVRPNRVRLQSGNI